INFEAFVTFVDEIGGIDIEVPETIDDPLYPDNNYGYDPLYIEAGRHHFYGDMALKYARTRHSGNGDFDRARRQQQVIQAVLDRVSRPEVLAQLIAKAPELYSKVESSLATSLKFDQLLALAGLAREVDPDNIRFAVIDESSTLPWETPEGWQVLVPIHDRIRERRDFVFWIGPAVEDNGAAEEGATLLVLNGTQREGLAYATAEYLKENRVPVATYSNADRQDYESSLVIMNRSLPQTAQRLLALLQLPDSALVQGDNPTAEYDIVIILGRDYAEP
ncbi:MAG TPA: LCP family protein, partial [Anaerolineae bacterium]|nr:LCP family protein [Anaerolineae bacterium]